MHQPIHIKSKANKQRRPTSKHKPSDLADWSKAIARHADVTSTQSYGRGKTRAGAPSEPRHTRQYAHAGNEWFQPAQMREDTTGAALGQNRAQARGPLIIRIPIYFLLFGGIASLAKPVSADNGSAHSLELPVCGTNGLGSILHEQIATAPRRPKIGARLLREANIDPKGNCTATLFPAHRLGKHGQRQTAPRTGQMNCLEALLQRDASGWLVQRQAVPELEDIPSAKKVFDSEFERHVKESHSEMAESLKDAYEQAGFDVDSKEYKVAYYRICVRFKGVVLPGGSAICGTLGGLHRLTKGGSVQYKSYTPNQCNELQSLPHDHRERAAWVRRNLHLFYNAPFTDMESVDEIDAKIIHRDLSLSEVIEKDTKKVVDEVFSPLKDYLHASTSFEKITEIGNDIAFPLHGAVKAYRKGNYFEAVFSAALDVTTVGLGAAMAGVKGVGVGWKAARVGTRHTLGRFRSLATRVVQHNTSKLATKLARGGVCWDAVINLQRNARMISASTARTMHVATRAKSFSAFLKNPRRVISASSFKSVSAGHRIGFVGVDDNALKHAMLSTGNGKAIGVNNGFLDPKFSPGWTEIDLTQDLRWEGRHVYSSDGRVPMRLIVDDAV